MEEVDSAVKMRGLRTNIGLVCETERGEKDGCLQTCRYNMRAEIMNICVGLTTCQMPGMVLSTLAYMNSFNSHTSCESGRIITPLDR